MRAAQLVAPRQWQLLETDKPAPGPQQMLVRMERVAICGSDQPPFSGVHDSYPLPMGRTGHEGLGIVEDCPSGQYRPGQRVLLWGFDRGLFQEYVLINDLDGCIPLPAEGDPSVLLMSQLLGTVIHAFYKLGNVINQDVVVMGQGPVGQLFVATLRNLGARRIIAVDPLPGRLEVSKVMGATHTVNPSETDLEAAIIDITEGKLADILVEAVGLNETFNLCPPLIRRNGTLVYFGVPDKENQEGLMQLRFLDMFRKELRIITTVGPNPQMDYTIAFDWIIQGRLDVSPILTHLLPFDKIQQGFEMAFERPGESASLKIVLDFDQ
ncbi:MAG: zinc-binding dehydrogenase [Candidatus Latescibacteria bacterium]|nr:zinc-binding dehydrogenase [Candidatus Latescibacterota bacterium]